MDLKTAQRIVGVDVDGRWGPNTCNAIAAQMKRDNSDERFHDLKLGKYFTVGEMLFSQTAVRRRLSNLPTGHQLLSLHRLVVHVLDPVREHFGAPVRVSSGLRGPALNRAVGGSRSSQHCLGEAADFRVSGRTVKEVCIWIRENLVYDQLIFEFGRWTHVSYRKGRNRKDWKSAVKRRVAGFMRTRYLNRVFTT